jgi:hypothetical protein
MERDRLRTRAGVAQALTIKVDRLVNLTAE